MSDPEPPRMPEDQLMREAAGWFARMRGPDAEESREEFEAWLRRGALHRGAYNRAAEIFAMGKLMGDEPRPPPRKRRLVAAVVSGALLVLALTFLFTTRVISSGVTPGDRLLADGGDAGPPTLLLAARGGEGRTVRLEDGSSVTLGGDSAVEVRLGATVRSLVLTRGRARFAVFREPRPFLVHAGGGTVTARGTVFEVALGHDRRVTVRLIEGMVDVAPPPEKQGRAPVPAVRRLEPGMAVSFASAGEGRAGAASGASRPEAEGLPSAGAARDFEDVTVAELVAEANRGSSRPIRLEDPAIGQRRVAGRFRIGDSVIVAERLAILLDLQLDRGDRREIVLRNR